MRHAMHFGNNSAGIVHCEPMSKGCFCGISNFSMETSQAKRGAILQLHNEGYSDSEIGRRLAIHRSTVARWIRREEELGTTDNRHRSGRPRCTTPEDDQVMMMHI